MLLTPCNVCSDHEELRTNYTALLQQRDGSGPEYIALQEKYQALQAEVCSSTNKHQYTPTHSAQDDNSHLSEAEADLSLLLLCCYDVLQHAQMEEHAHELAEIAELYMQDHSADQAPANGSGLAGLLQVPQQQQPHHPEAQRQWQPQQQQPMREGLQPTYSMPVMGQQQQQHQMHQQQLQQQAPQWSANARTMSAYAGAPGRHAAAGRGDR